MSWNNPEKPWKMQRNKKFGEELSGIEPSWNQLEYWEQSSREKRLSLNLIFATIASCFWCENITVSPRNEGDQGDQFGNVRKLKFDRMVNIQTRICPEEWDAHNSLQRIDLEIINNIRKVNVSFCRLCSPDELQSENQKERVVFRPYQRAKTAWNGPLNFRKGAGRFYNWWTSRDHSNNIIVKIDKNIEENFGDWRKLAVTQTPKEDLYLNLVWKRRKE